MSTSRCRRTTEPAELAAKLAQFFNRLEDHAVGDPANAVSPQVQEQSVRWGASDPELRRANRWGAGTSR